jgi:hypothetical protein
VAPRARLERATYCLGGLRGLCPDLPISRSAAPWPARECPWFTAVHRPIGHATGTSPTVAHDGWHLGALVLVITERPTHYERVLVRCSRVQYPR